MTLLEGASIILQAVYMVAFMYGVVLLIEAAWQLKSSQVAEAFNGILAALFLTMGPSLLRLFFSLFSLPGAFDL